MLAEKISEFRHLQLARIISKVDDERHWSYCEQHYFIRFAE